MKPLGEVIRRCGLRNHQYADDTQLYLSFSTNPGEAVAVLNRCLAEVMGWMRANKVKLNPDKTEVLLVGGLGFGEVELNLVLNGVALPLRDKVRSLGVLLDPELSLEAQVTVVARSAFFQLRLIHQLCPYLEYDCLVTVTHALVTSRLDFCNVLYVGLPLKMVWILQLVQNRTARLLTGTGRYAHMTPVLRQLHWLPIEVRAQFKVLVITYKALGPGYLKESLRPYMPARPLRSAGEALLQEHSVKEFRSLGTQRRAFSAVAPNLWNVLPRESLLLGVLLAIAGNFLISISLNLQKCSHLRLMHQASQKPCYRSKLWWCGTILMGIGELGNFAAYGLAAAMVIAPLGSMAVIGSAVISIMFLKGSIRSEGILGGTMTIAGTFLLVTFAPRITQELTARKIQNDLVSWQFLIYVILEIITFCILFYFHKRKEVKHIVILLVMVALLASLSIISTKAVATMIMVSVKGNMQLTYPIFYVMFILMVLTCTFQVKFLNKAMNLYAAAEVIPMNYVFFTISAILTGHDEDNIKHILDPIDCTGRELTEQSFGPRESIAGTRGYVCVPLPSL
ncbi:NIPA-like protein 2 [Varanus komodoensis]|nr:NIPA-like protein 2 [Varanus komodoensis]